MSTLGCRARRSDANAALDGTIGTMSAPRRSGTRLALTGGPEGGGTGGRIGGGVTGGSVLVFSTIVFSMSLCCSVVGPDLLLPGKGVGGGVAGGVVGTGTGVTSGTVADVNVAIVESITVCLASASAPLTCGRPLGVMPALAVVRIAAVQTPEVETPPGPGAEVLAAALTTREPAGRARGPAET